MPFKRLSAISILLLLCGCLSTGTINSIEPQTVNPALYADPIGEKTYTAVDFSDNVKNITGNIEETVIKVEVEEPPQPILDQVLDFCTASQDFWANNELENALQSLDQAYALLINTDTTGSPKLVQQKEDLRYVISKRILEIYASRNIAVTGTHNAIPITINKAVQKEIDIFTKKDRRFFIESVQRSGMYRPMILKALKEAGMPPELSWLPLVESGFKVKALSQARALGLWQFIPSTGYMFGLKRDLFVDERLHPEKATHAAIAYLKSMHKMFGDWSTVLAAYNCGEGRVLRIIRSQNVNYLDNFWDLYSKLPSETARYVPKFIATLHIINNMEKYGFDSIKEKPPLDYEIVKINRQARLGDIAKAINQTKKSLQNLNPELRYNILPAKEYDLYVPPGKSAPLLAVIDQVKITLPPQKAFVYHRVKFGETLSTIAEKYKTSTRKIAKANKISKRNFIVAGKILKIPQRGYITPRTRTRAGNNRKINLASRHIVKSGDSLWIIARRYGTTTQKLKMENNLTGTSLRIGQRLKIPGRSAGTASSSSSGFYRVKRGDSPFTIAMRYKMSVSRFLDLNKLTARSKIFPGQKVYIE